MSFEQIIGITEEQFYRDYYKTAEYIFKMILPPIGKEEDIEEGVHDVLLEVMNHPEKYDQSRGGLKNYLRVVSRSKALHMRKKLSSKKTIPLQEDFMISYHDELFTQELIKTIIQNLKPDERRLFTLRFLYQMPIEEIATQLGKNRRSIDTALSRLRKKITKQLKEHEIEGV